MRGNNLTSLRKYLLFGVMIIAVAVMLNLLNWVPTVFQKEGVKKYKTIEDAKGELKMSDLLLPSYFPQYLIWPPSEIFGRRRPAKMVLMHFINYDRKDTVLSVMQAETADPHPIKSRIEPVKTRKREGILIKGIRGELSLGLCAGGEPCNSVTWESDGYTFTIIAKDSVEELRKIAESMISQWQP
jgi:hypothetical protein